MVNKPLIRPYLLGGGGGIGGVSLGSHENGVVAQKNDPMLGWFGIQPSELT